MPPVPLPTTARKNVEAIAKVEQQLLERRSRVERVGDRIARFFGSLGFISAHIAVLAVWIAVNTRVLPGVAPFDPYPFPFLGLIVGVGSDPTGAPFSLR
jgi:uncharacterized membrane protein